MIEVNSRLITGRIITSLTDHPETWKRGGGSILEFENSGEVRECIEIDVSRGEVEVRSIGHAKVKIPLNRSDQKLIRNFAQIVRENLTNTALTVGVATLFRLPA